MAYKQKPVSHRSGCWDPQGQGAYRLCLLRTQFLVHRQLSFCCVLTWWVRWGISMGLFPRGTNSLHEGSTLIMHFHLYSPAPSFQYTFCKTNSTQWFSLYLSKAFFEYTNFLNPIFHSFWFSGWVLFSLGTIWICVAYVFGQAHPILPLYQEIEKMYTFLTL